MVCLLSGLTVFILQNKLVKLKLSVLVPSVPRHCSLGARTCKLLLLLFSFKFLVFFSSVLTYSVFVPSLL